MLKVEGHPNLYRDENTGAILNCDDNSYLNYVRSREKRNVQKEEIDKIKSDIEEIKSMLKQIIN